MFLLLVFETRVWLCRYRLEVNISCVTETHPAADEGCSARWPHSRPTPWRRSASPLSADLRCSMSTLALPTEINKPLRSHPGWWIHQKKHIERFREVCISMPLARKEIWPTWPLATMMMNVFNSQYFKGTRWQLSYQAQLQKEHRADGWL